MEHAETQGAALPRALAGTGDWDRVIDHVDLLGLTTSFVVWAIFGALFVGSCLLLGSPPSPSTPC